MPLTDTFCKRAPRAADRPRERFADSGGLYQGWRPSPTLAMEVPLTWARSADCVNAQIERFLAGGGLERLLSEGAAPLAPLPPEASRTDRRHAKLAQRLNPAADPHPTPLSDEVWGAIAERRFIVPRRSYAMDQGHTNLHAERRLADFARQSTGQDMDIDMLAGTMRPCGTCADAIEAPLETHRRPYWMSKASTAGRDVPADIQRSAVQWAGNARRLGFPARARPTAQLPNTDRLPTSFMSSSRISSALSRPRTRRRRSTSSGATR